MPTDRILSAGEIERRSGYDHIMPKDNNFNPKEKGSASAGTSRPEHGTKAK
jgi:hypothetical protein